MNQSLSFLAIIFIWTGSGTIKAFSYQPFRRITTIGRTTPIEIPTRSQLTTVTLAVGAFSTDQEEKDFLDKTKQLCLQRNIPFTKIKNARDLSSIPQSPIAPNRVFRTGRVSDATAEDVHILMDQIQIKTLVDLRSPTELKEDLTLDRTFVFGNFTNMIWVERKNGLVRELAPGESFVDWRRASHHHSRIEEGGNWSLKKQHMGSKMDWKEMVGGIRRGFVAAGSNNTTTADKDIIIGESESSSSSLMDGPVLDLRAAADLAAVMTELDDETDTAVLVMDSNLSQSVALDEEEDDSSVDIAIGGSSKEGVDRKRFTANYPPGSLFLTSDDKMVAKRAHRKERHFVSMMNELKYIRGTLSKLRKRDIAKVIIQSPGAILSRRVRRNVKDVFLDQINGGGLPLLNELLLRFGAPAIRYVLELCSDKSRHPIAFYCTAGKDRTGVIAAIIHAVVGVPDEDIIEDYSLSANVYAEMNDHKAMVGALSQRSLNPKTFLGAPPHVMKETLESIRKGYGSVEAYLDSIGFDAASRQRLKEALTA